MVRSVKKAGFSTLGCPGVPLDEVLRMAAKYSAQLVQLRVSPDEPVNTSLTAQQRADIREQFDEAGIAFAALATYVKLSDTDFLEPLTDHLRLAKDLGAPALRLFPGDATFKVASYRLQQACEASQGSGVRMTVETHDSYLRGCQIAELLDAADGAAGAVWDVLHTWRAGESIADSFAALRPFLAELQIKDVKSAQDLRPLIPGTGSLPLREALDMAQASDYDGPVIFEHEAKWRADAEPFEAALAAAMSMILD